MHLMLTVTAPHCHTLTMEEAQRAVKLSHMQRVITMQRGQKGLVVPEYKLPTVTMLHEISVRSEEGRVSLFERPCEAVAMLGTFLGRDVKQLAIRLHVNEYSRIWHMARHVCSSHCANAEVEF